MNEDIISSEVMIDTRTKFFENILFFIVSPIINVFSVA